MKHEQTKTFGILVLLMYLVIPILFFQNVNSLGDGRQMTSMPNCPHEEGKQAVCPMDFSFYSGVFGVISTINIRDLQIFIFILILGLLCKFIYKEPQNTKPALYFKNQKYKNLVCLYQRLYSNGILNGKAY